MQKTELSEAGRRGGNYCSSEAEQMELFELPKRKKMKTEMISTCSKRFSHSLNLRVSLWTSAKGGHIVTGHGHSLTPIAAESSF
jgi:hypothetical protein